LLSNIKARNKIKCPFCSRIGHNDIWPSIEVLDLLKMAMSLDVSINHKKNISYVIVEASLELMLENIISTFLLPDIMPEHVSITIMTDALLDGYQGRNRLLSLFKKLEYGSFPESAKQFGKPNFMKQWDRIALRRNKFVHGKLLKEAEQEDDSDNINIEEFIQDSFYVFKEINNRFIKSHFENRSTEYLVF
jgi:hypothetical protein